MSNTEKPSPVIHKTEFIEIGRYGHIRVITRPDGIEIEAPSILGMDSARIFISRLNVSELVRVLARSDA